MNKQQTAVEWLTEMITDMIHEAHHSELADLFESAKAMEKERTLVDYSCGARDAILNIDFVDAIKYYNETYGGDK
jgi:hypothetical protein